MTARRRPPARPGARRAGASTASIISDYGAIAELVTQGVAADLVEAAALALKAGVDIDMMGDAYREGLPVALERGLVEMATSTPRCAAC